MSIDKNKSVVKRFYEELWNNRRLSVADEIFDGNCVTHQLRSGEGTVDMERGPTAMKQHVEEWLAGFPDLRFEIHEIVAEGDLVASRSAMHGSHTGRWMGLEPTGKQVEIRMAVTHKIKGGLIVEDWVLVDTLGFLQQLDLIPSASDLIEAASRGSRPRALSTDPRA